MKRRLIGLLVVVFGLGMMVWMGAAHAASTEPGASSNETVSRTVNARLNPLALLLGSISGDVDFRVSPRITLGPSLSYLSASVGDTGLKGFGIGARMNIYLTGEAISDSWFVGPSVGYSHFSVSGGGTSASQSSFSLGAVLGHQWVWASGFNINLGLGASYYTASSSVDAGNGVSLDVPFFHGVQPNGELTLGWAF